MDVDFNSDFSEKCLNSLEKSGDILESTAKAFAEIISPQTLFLGNIFFSNMATLSPEFFNPRAAAQPAGPAPTISTSYFSDLLLSSILFKSGLAKVILISNYKKIISVFFI